MHDLIGIKSFVAVAEAGSFVLAAERLNQSRSVISHHIAKLERDLGTRLFNRSTRKVCLTQDGQRYLARAKPLLHEAVDLFHEMKAQTGSIAGRLKLTVPPGIAEYLLLKPTFEFMQMHPDVEITLDVDARHVDVIAEGYDAAIRSGALVGSALKSRRLTSIHFGMFASAEYLSRHGSPAIVADLTEHQVAHWYVPGGQAPWQFKTSDGVEQVTVSGAFVTNSVQGQLTAVREGLAIAALPTFLVRKDVGSGAIVTVLKDALIPPTPVWVIWPENSFETPKLRAYIDHLVAALNK